MQNSWSFTRERTHHIRQSVSLEAVTVNKLVAHRNYFKGVNVATANAHYYMS